MDGTAVAFGGPTGRLHRFDLGTGKVRLGGDATRGMWPDALTPDGKHLITWDTVNPRPNCTLFDGAQFDKPRVYTAPGVPGEVGGTVAAAVSPDGKTVAALIVHCRRDPRFDVRVAVGHRLSLWDVATGKERHAEGFRPAPGQSFWPGERWTLAFLDGGQTLVSVVQGGPDNGLVQFWDTATLQERRRFQLPLPERHALAFSPDGNLVAGPDGNDVCVWRTDTGKEVKRFRGHRGAVSALAFSPDGRVLASGSADTTNLVWEVLGLR
jgi:WD40 repeat protein